MTIYPSQLVGEKVGFALASGLKVIACLGEHLNEREGGKTEEDVARQIKTISGRLGRLYHSNVGIDHLCGGEHIDNRAFPLHV